MIVLGSVCEERIAATLQNALGAGRAACSPEAIRGTIRPDSAEPALSAVEGLHPGYGAIMPKLTHPMTALTGSSLRRPASPLRAQTRGERDAVFVAFWPSKAVRSRGP